ncbi:Growth-regulating factor 5, putative [Theobroma cacao]|uniref:Growth-regulating factor n=1 Tax=Theobroma cacao TaxID=3641 RepID=A0A061GCX3_THECC|nr:Growth-regulating factor 5, putative [Theobroma cacao]
MISARNRSPFTPTQWQELEHQALIFKYMVSGVPIPPELIYSVKRSLDSSLASRLFPHQPIGWGCFQVGFGRKADPEPGRCRRTDGKKWRCSKEAYPESKYCERHMHRGRNRSRKPVEVNSTTAVCTTPPPTTSSILSPSFSTINRNLSISTSSNSSLSSSSSSFSFSPLSSSPIAPEIYAHHNPNQITHLNPFLYSHPSTSTRPPGSGLSFQNDTSPHHFLDSGAGIVSYSHANKDYRYVHGTREGMDERSFFPEASGSARVVSDSYQPLTVSSYKSYPQSEYQSFGDSGSKQRQQQQQEQHCFVLGTDIKSARPIKLEKDDETQKQVHQFFGDHWPPRNTDSWLDLASNSGVHSDS